FPNPTDGKKLNLTTTGLNQEERVSIQITSVHGKTMFIAYFDADDRGVINIPLLNIANWSNGIYIITLHTEKGLIQSRIVKK
ncbi:MAG: T9SS type A sorting domain-containing protein, partial [Candidatus Anammoxibacter sp.]